MVESEVTTLRSGSTMLESSLYFMSSKDHHTDFLNGNGLEFDVIDYRYRKNFYDSDGENSLLDNSEKDESCSPVNLLDPFATFSDQSNCGTPSGLELDHLDVFSTASSPASSSTSTSPPSLDHVMPSFYSSIMEEANANLVFQDTFSLPLSNNASTNSNDGLASLSRRGSLSASNGKVLNLNSNNTVSDITGSHEVHDNDSNGGLGYLDLSEIYDNSNSGESTSLNFYTGDLLLDGVVGHNNNSLDLFDMNQFSNEANSMENVHVEQRIGASNNNSHSQKGFVMEERGTHKLDLLLTTPTQGDFHLSDNSHLNRDSKEKTNYKKNNNNNHHNNYNNNNNNNNNSNNSNNSNNNNNNNIIAMASTNNSNINKNNNKSQGNDNDDDDADEEDDEDDDKKKIKDMKELLTINVLSDGNDARMLVPTSTPQSANSSPVPPSRQTLLSFSSSALVGTVFKNINTMTMLNQFDNSMTPISAPPSAFSSPNRRLLEESSLLSLDTGIFLPQSNHALDDILVTDNDNTNNPKNAIDENHVDKGSNDIQPQELDNRYQENNDVNHNDSSGNVDTLEFGSSVPNNERLNYRLVGDPFIHFDANETWYAWNCKDHSKHATHHVSVSENYNAEEDVDVVEEEEEVVVDDVSGTLHDNTSNGNGDDEEDEEINVTSCSDNENDGEMVNVDSNSRRKVKRNSKKQKPQQQKTGIPTSKNAKFRANIPSFGVSLPKNWSTKSSFSFSSSPVHDEMVQGLKRNSSFEEEEQEYNQKRFYSDNSEYSNDNNSHNINNENDSNYNSEHSHSQGTSYYYDQVNVVDYQSDNYGYDDQQYQQQHHHQEVPPPPPPRDYEQHQETSPPSFQRSYSNSNHNDADAAHGNSWTSKGRPRRRSSHRDSYDRYDRTYPGHGYTSNSSNSKKANAISQEDADYERLCTVFVGDLPQNLSNRSLSLLFEPFGNVANIRTFPKKNYAFIRYENSEQAQSAITHLHDTLYKGSRLRLGCGGRRLFCEGEWKDTDNHKLNYSESHYQDDDLSFDEKLKKLMNRR